MGRGALDLVGERADLRGVLLVDAAAMAASAATCRSAFSLSFQTMSCNASQRSLARMMRGRRTCVPLP